MKANRIVIITCLLFTLLYSVFALAQQKFVLTGKVVSVESGEPLAGANISLEGTKLGTISRADGTFRFPALPPGSYRLTVRYIGYSEKTIEIELDAQTQPIDIALSQTVLTGPIITVFATRAHERLSPVTFSAIEKKDIEARYPIQDIPEIIADLPSTTFYSEGGHGLGYNYLSIRGFDQRRISVLINGVPQNDPEDHNVYWVDFPDLTANVESIQVQRGAGSAFYGPAAIGGSINILTDYFSPNREIKASFGRGAFDTEKISLSLNSGLLKKKFVLYGRFSNIKTDGYRRNAWIDFRSYFAGAAMYTKRSNLRFHFYGGPIEDGLAYVGIPKSFNDSDSLRRINFLGPREIENFNQPHFELLHEYRLSSSLTLNQTAFFIRGYGFFDYDGSWGTPEYFRLTPGYGYNVDAIPGDALIRAYVDNKQGGWISQLSWRHRGGELVVGAELRRHRSLHWGRLQEGTGLPADVVGDGARRYYQYRGGKDIASLYAREIYRLRPEFIFSADVQLAYKRYKLYDEKFLDNEFAVPYWFFNPRVGVNYNISESVNIYTNLSRTSREPRLKNLYDAAEASTPADWGAVLPQFEINPDGSYNFDAPLVKPERLTDLELGIGFRNPWLRGTLNAYYMDFRDEIIKKGGLDRFGQPITGNAERTLHAGVELNAEVQLLPQLALGANFLASRNTLKSYRVYGSDGRSIVLDGNPIAGFPGTLANLHLTYSWRGVFASLIWKYVGKQYTDNFKSEENSVPAYNVLHAAVRLELGRIGLRGVTLQARVNNILNKKYLAHGEGEDFFPAATRHAFVSLQYTFR